MHYRSIPEMAEYISIEQKKRQVIQYAKTETGQWPPSEYAGETAVLRSKAIDFEISLLDLYEGIDFGST